MGIMNSFVNDIFERIAGESSRLAHYNKLHHHIERDPDRRASAAARLMTLKYPNEDTSSVIMEYGYRCWQHSGSDPEESWESMS
ncbi:histone H2B-like protein [Labeo rohita]|uniref:Histone H2B-like protein n=1 Tax=Labeo rohita TaxID=84645 RepID=A0A498NM99_LABRO|nr:histone H2B-like protein [Labeo rohita]